MQTIIVNRHSLFHGLGLPTSFCVLNLVDTANSFNLLYVDIDTNLAFFITTPFYDEVGINIHKQY